LTEHFNALTYSHGKLPCCCLAAADIALIPRSYMRTPDETYGAAGSDRPDQVYQHQAFISPNPAISPQI
jgi:hypothetical protein